MTFILSIETSTSVCSAAIHEDGKLISSKEVYAEKSHSKVITVFIEEMLSELKRTMNDMSAVAVSKGPGSYTGLRIGVSTAKGICYALEKPLIGVNTLDSMALGVNQSNENKYLLCPMIDARRMEVYCALYDSELKSLERTQAKIIDENSFSEYLEKNRVLFFGDGASKCKTLLKNGNVFFLDDVYPSAKNIGYLAYDSYKKGQFEDVAYFEPFYLKDFVGKFS